MQLEESSSFHDENEQENSSTSPKNRLFSSPIQVVDLPETQRQESSSSPDLFIEFSNSFRRIVERGNESEGEEEILDIMGHPINEFDLKMEVEESEELPPVEENKENSVPAMAHLTTPLKIRKP